jgi:hypothetical protein
MLSQKFRDSRTGEIKTVIPVLEIPYFDKYNGPLEDGDVDLTCGKDRNETNTKENNHA